jgi:hypothetical protein
MSPGQVKHRALVTEQLKELRTPQTSEQELVGLGRKVEMNPQAAEFKVKIGNEEELAEGGGETKVQPMKAGTRKQRWARARRQAWLSR